jgi:hypothetical protein
MKNKKKLKQNILSSQGDQQRHLTREKFYDGSFVLIYKLLKTDSKLSHEFNQEMARFLPKVNDGHWEMIVNLLDYYHQDLCKML